VGMEKIKKFFYRLMVDENKSLFSYPVKFILWILSLIYGVVLWMRDAAYKMGIVKSQTLPDVKVISVGNLTTGGTGKTPMVIKLAIFLKEKGRKVAVLLRGYGRDEYILLRNYLKDIPVVKDKDRIKSGKEAIDKYGVDTLILDDGFQYKKLKKDFNILLLDSGRPFGNNHFLPRGILRERISNLKGADVVVFTKTSAEPATFDGAKAMLKKISGNAEIFFTFHKPLGLYDILSNKEFPPDCLKGEKIVSLSSIGDPQYFNRLLEDLGARRILEFSFLDHHNYTKREINKIIALCARNNLNTIVTTEKDAVKLTPLFKDEAVRVLSLKIKVEFRGDEDYFADRLLGIYSR